MKPNRFTTWLLRIGLMLFGLTIAVILCELVLRTMAISFPLPYSPDEHTGSRLQAGWEGWFTKEGSAYITINDAGFRDRDHSFEKPPNTFRVLVLGDSYVEALQLPQEKTFWSVMERELNRKFAAEEHGKQVEVISMGVSGWGTAQQSLALEHYGWAYDPDLVVLAFFAGNDLRNNTKDLESEVVRPFFFLRGGELQLDDSYLQHPLFLKAQSPWTKLKVTLINHSRLLQVLQEVKLRWKYGRQIEQAGATAGLDDKCFLEPSEPAWQQAWEITERLVRRMNDQCRRRNRSFAVALVTSAIQVHPDPAVRQEHAQRIGATDLSYSDNRLKALGESIGIPVIVLSEPLRQHAEQTGQYVHGFFNTTPGSGHWNETGHQVVGQVLAERLSRVLEPVEP